MRAKITKRVVDGTVPGERDRFVWDNELKGFGLKVTPRGRKVYIFQYRLPGSPTKRVTLGPHGGLTPDGARTLAKKLSGQIADNRDPAREHREAKQAQTVSELCDDYLDAGKGRIRDSTLAMDRSRIDRHVRPLLGERRVKSLTQEDLERFLADIAAGKTATRTPRAGERKRGGITRGGPGVANRTLGMLSTILERAVDKKIITENPAPRVKRLPSEPYRPPFSFELVKKLGDALKESEAAGENPKGILAIKLLLATGLRRNECLSLEWEAIDFTDQCFRLRGTKTGYSLRPAGQTALNLLNRNKAGTEQYVFPSDRGKGHFIGLPRVWQRISERAKFNQLNIHALRHWHASAAAAMDFSELTIAGLLGHKLKGVTSRYANAPDSALIAAANRVSEKLLSTLGSGTSRSNTISLNQRAFRE